MADVDALVVGAGAVGLACAYALAKRGYSVAVAEEQNRIGAGISSRNSEVIHAGLHYDPGSLKAELCVAGRRLLYDFLARHNVDHVRCGKLIVATEASEVDAIEELFARGRTNSVEGLSLLTRAQAQALEPQLRCVGAILSAQSGIFDAHGYMLALQGEIENLSGFVALNSAFRGASPVPDGFAVSINAADAITARALVLAPGLAAQAVASLLEAYPRERIPRRVLGKGNYFAVTGRAPFERLIYPPPIPGALGIHYRRDLGGQARLGPDLVYVDEEEYSVDVDRADYFYAYVRRFWPSLPDGALSPDYAGIRPKIHAADAPRADFRIDDHHVHGIANLVAIFGIESPGLTSSLALGEHVADIVVGGLK